MSTRQKGRRILVTANCFEIEARRPSKPYNHYDVVIGKSESQDPDRTMPSRRAHEIVGKLQEAYPQVFTPMALYDGRANMYSTNDNLAGTYQVQMGRHPTKGVFRIIVQKVATIEPREINTLIQGRVTPGGSLVAVNLVQIILQQAPHKHGAPHTKAFYYSNGEKDLTRGLKLWNGFFQSVRPVLGKLLVNVDVAHTAVYTSGPLVQQAMSFLELRNIRALGHIQDDAPDKWRALRSFLRHVMVEITIAGAQKRTKKIMDLVPVAGKFPFVNDGQSTTVQDYFRYKHNMHLQHPEVFGIKINKTAVFPAEVCQVIPGQIFKKKLLPIQTSKFVELSAKRPDARLQAIRQGISGTHLNYGGSPFLTDAGMQVNSSPLQIQGCVLNTPDILYHDGKLAIRSGAWNVKGQHFVVPQPVKSWAVVNFSEASLKVVQGFVMNLQTNLQNLGCTFPSGYPVIEPGHPHNVDGALSDICKQTVAKVKIAPSFLLVMLPASAPDIRKSVKQWGDIKFGVATQCVKQGKFENANDQYINNVALKINAKIGGVNSCASHSVLHNLTDTMAVGVDVGHPGPGVITRPSITSLVSSVDSDFTRYVAQARIQQPRMEIIQDIGDMTSEALKEFYAYPGRQNKVLPKNIIFFRDGVSEGEYQDVSSKELMQIDDALHKVSTMLGLKKPAVVFIVVGKRHHIRFFPTTQEDTDKTGNCPPGLIVDSAITSGVVQDFYLQSHSGIRGTSRPAHYIVLRNEAQWPIETLQEIAYTLCHVYASATRSVSIPAPVYYADRVCSRVDFHFHPNWNFEHSDVISGTGDGHPPPFDLEYWKKGFGQARNNKRMYFL